MEEISSLWFVFFIDFLKFGCNFQFKIISKCIRSTLKTAQLIFQLSEKNNWKNTQNYNEYKEFSIGMVFNISISLRHRMLWCTIGCRILRSFWMFKKQNILYVIIAEWHEPVNEILFWDCYEFSVDLPLQYMVWYYLNFLAFVPNTFSGKQLANF